MPCRNGAHIGQPGIRDPRATNQGTASAAVLGFGDVGPEAVLPVMEGEAVFFKRFAGVP